MRIFIILISMVFFLSTMSVAKEVCKLPKRPYYKKPQCVAGKLVPDAYQSGISNLCEDTHYDHFISIYQGFCSGLSEEKLKKLAQDPRNLKPTHKSINLSKGAKDTFKFVKTLKGDKLKRNLLFDYIGLKKDYGLKVTSVEYDELFNLETKLKARAATAAAVKKARKVKLGKRILPFDDAVRVVTKNIAYRTTLRGMRSIGTLPAQSIPYYGVAVILGVTAWDITDACLTMRELQAISNALDEDEELNADVKKVCGREVPTREELILSVKKSPSKSMESASEFLADIESIEVDFDNIDFSNIWESSKIRSSNLIGVTNDKGKELVEDAASKASNFSKNIKSWWSED